MEKKYFKKVIFINPEEKATMQEILDIEEGHAKDYKRDGVIEVFSTIFDTPYGKYGVDIKVCNGDTPYVDPVLFEVVEQNGVNHWHEIYPLDVDDTLEGEYQFETDEEKHGVRVILQVLVVSKDNIDKEELCLSNVPVEEVVQTIKRLNFEEVDCEPIQFSLEMRGKKSTKQGIKTTFAKRDSDLEISLMVYEGSEGRTITSSHKEKGFVFADIVEQLQTEQEQMNVSVEELF